MSLDSVRDVFRLVQDKSLESFPDMTWHIFIWHCGSSIFIHGICGLVCFYLLRKHKFGRLFSILILIWGVLMPMTGGLITTIFLAWVQAASDIKISPLVACFFGCGQTLFWIVIGVSRILATI